MPDQASARTDSQPIRPAATVMLVRDAPDGLQVYLLRRVAEMVFAGGMTVFPGGGVDPRDSAPIGWEGPDADWWAQQFGIERELARSVVIAAIREVFEETGVLLADVPADAPALRASEQEALRQRIDDHEIGLVDVLGGGVVNSARLRPWARWITPPGNTRRYDTFFLLAELPTGAEPRMLTTEAEFGQWINPRRALEAGERGEMGLLPPTVAMLTSLAEFDSVTQAVATRKDIHALSPVIISGPGEPIRVSVDGVEYRAYIGR